MRLLSFYRINTNISQYSTLLVKNILNNRMKTEDLYATNKESLPENLNVYFEILKRYSME